MIQKILKKIEKLKQTDEEYWQRGLLGICIGLAIVGVILFLYFKCGIIIF